MKVQYDFHKKASYYHFGVIVKNQLSLEKCTDFLSQAEPGALEQFASYIASSYSYSHSYCSPLQGLSTVVLLVFEQHLNFNSVLSLFV